MRKKIILIIILVSSISVFSKDRQDRTDDKILAASVKVSRSEAEQYSKILAKMGNYSLYCDMAKTNNDRELSNAYAQKHQEWRDIDKKSWVPFGGEDAFDENNTKEFNLASIEFIEQRDSSSSIPGHGIQLVCSKGKKEFKKLLKLNSQELLSHIRKIISTKDKAAEIINEEDDE